MEGISSISGIGASSPPARGPRDIKDLDMDQFLKLLITELQNQDPLNPMNNSELLQQLGQIRQIISTTQLTESLNAVVAGQNLAIASNLIGRKISALSEDRREVTGVVERVTVETQEGTTRQRTVLLHVGDARVRLENVRQVER